MHLLAPLATLLGVQLLLPAVLAGGSYHNACYCYDAQGNRDGPATHSGCDAIDSSDFGYEEDSGQPRCKATLGHGINNHCFKCLCKRTPGLDGDCYDYGLNPGSWDKIKCGGGC